MEIIFGGHGKSWKSHGKFLVKKCGNHGKSWEPSLQSYYCITEAAWLSGNIVALRRARLVLGWVTVHGYTILVFNHSNPGLLSLATPPWVGTVGGGLNHR